MNNLANIAPFKIYSDDRRDAHYFDSLTTSATAIVQIYKSNEWLRYLSYLLIIDNLW